MTDGDGAAGRRTDMERLTKRDGNFVALEQKPREVLCGTGYCGIAFMCRTCPYLKIIDRLAAYEYAELSPEEIIELKARMEGVEK